MNQFSIADYYYNLQTNGTSSPYKFYPPSNSGPLGSRYFICRSIHNRVRHAFLRSHCCSTTHQSLSASLPPSLIEHTPDYLRIRRGGIYKLIMDNTAGNDTSSTADVQSAENFINNLVEGTNNNNQPTPPPSGTSPMDIDNSNNPPPPPPPPAQEEQASTKEPSLDVLAGKEASQKMPSNNNNTNANNNNNMSHQDAIFNPPPPEPIINAAAAAGGNPNPQNNNNTNGEEARKTEGGKAPRSENKWLRNSPTSIGDGYTSILNSLSTIHSTFNQITSNTMSGSILGGNSPEYQTILIRLNTIKVNCNMLCTNQLQNRLVNDYNLPLLIRDEILHCEKKLVQLSSSSGGISNGGSDGSEGMNDELKKIQETLSKIKPFSIELSNQLSTSIQSNKEKHLEDGDMNLRQPKLKSTLVTNVNGSGVGGVGGDGSSMGRGDGSRQGISGRSKTLPMIGKLHQPKPQQRLQDSNNPFESHSLEMFDKLQFLQPTTTTNDNEDGSTEMNMKNGISRDYSKRITFQGDVIDRIAAVPTSAVPTSANEIMPTNGNNNNNSSMISSEAMNGIYPTMAPPMLPHKSTYSAAYGGNELDYALENKLQNKNKKGKKKRKKKRGRDSTDSTSGPKKKRGRGRPRLYSSDSDDDDLKSSNNVRKSNGYVRTIPEFTITHQTHTITTDANPNRVCNPLLRLPQFPDGKDPSIIDIPQAAELWKLSDLHYYDGDTYPVSYLARILGFDVKEDATNEEFGKEFDVGKIGKMNESDGDCNDYASLVPARGTFCDRVWKKQDGKASISSSVLASTLATSEGLTDDLNLTYFDPLWANILSSYKGYNEDDFKDAGKGFADDLSQLCLDYARERGLILKKEKTDRVESLSDQKKSAKKEEVYKNDRMRFRFATEKDEEMLSSLTEKVSAHMCITYLSLYPFVSSSHNCNLSFIIVSMEIQSKA